MKRALGAAIVVFSAVLLRLSCVGPPPPPLSVTADHLSVEVPSGAPPAYTADPLGFLCNAPPDSLLLLPGIGPVLAERIAKARTGRRSFTRWEDLLAVKGIGPKKLEVLRSYADKAP